MGRDIGWLFQQNNGVLTTGQLIDAGISTERIAGLVRKGTLVSLRRGAYTPGVVAVNAPAGSARAEALRVAAAIARSRTGLVASHRSAAIMHGLDLLTVASAKVATVTQPRHGPGSRTGYAGLRVYTAALPQTRFGVRCTTVARTVVDLARSGSLEAGVVVADHALHEKKTTRAELAAVLAECERWPGVATARRAVEFSDGRAESVLESLARVVLAEHGLEPPELQVWVGGDGVRVGRVDFLWRAHRTVAEADGKEKYQDPGAALRQLKRDAMLRDAGFEVVHFSWADIAYQPEEVIGRILAAFERAERLR